MKLRTLFAAAVLLLAAPALAQSPYSARQAILASTFDLDGEAADDNQIVEAVDVEDDKDDYVIAAQPDVCRLIDVTVTDADSSITDGTLTITGTDCWGKALVATYTFAAGGSVVLSGAVADAAQASGAYFASVSEVATGTLTGEAAGDQIEVGYISNSANSFPMYGRLSSLPSGRRSVDPFGTYDVPVLVTNGAATTDVIAVSASTTAPFENVSVGDLLVFNVNGEQITRRVATRTDADTITVNAGVTLPAAGRTFSYRKLYFLADPQDGWIAVTGYDVVTFMVQVDLNANTGGVISSVQCATAAVDGSGAMDIVFEEDTATVASAATGTDTTTVDLRSKPHYTHCRVGVRFGTGDDADAAAEDIDIVVGFRK
jgi:hypothetical protein